MRIARLRLKNWLAYRGEHVLDLEAKVYAIVASVLGDQESSNWCGKSSLLEAVVFAIYGDHRHRTEDEWISEGEPSGEVEVTLDDGSRILRSRARGKRTTVYFYEEGAEAAMQDRAQERIEEVVGLSRTDFGATCYWEQKQMSRFIVARPEERTQVVGSWFRIEPIKDCEKRVRSASADLELDFARVDEHLRSLAATEASTAEALKAVMAASKADTPELLVARLEASLEASKGRIATGEDELQRNAELAAAKGKVLDYEQVVDEGKRVRADLDGRRLPVLQDAWKAADAAANEKGLAWGRAHDRSGALEPVAKGEFDGRCPVSPIDCPAKDAINRSRDVGRAEFKKAVDEQEVARAAFAEAKAAEAKARATMQEAERIGQRLESLREQAARLAPIAKAARAAGEPEDPAIVRGRLDAERGTMMELASGITRVRTWQADLAKVEATRAQLVARRAELEAKLVIFREAAAVFKAAQRRVAEGSLALIQRDANTVLRDCGAALEIEVSWSREGKELATACESCGHHFPKSAKVKNCERCGADRGNKVENKLEILLSRRSGAAEDLAGGAFELAASRWLREARGTSWSTALIDEPFGALDAKHRKGFAAHLTAMLAGRYGFDQAFVCAHHASVLDALPGRIAIVNDGKWSSVKVVA